MNNSLIVDLSNCNVVETLLPELVERIGFEKTKRAINQALDLQRMNSSKSNLPILISETCGLALINVDTFYFQTGILCNRKGVVLLLSIRNNAMQVICET
mgnify:CR=1 FL=1|tara:strand:+ start:715 stop:1014 length:300 start_codon:yes stop_codon:yes gene_type:complete